MKTPKANKLSPKDKFSGPKLGKVKKSAINVPGKKLSALSNIKNTDQALEILKNSKDNVSIKASMKKEKGKPLNSFNESPKVIPQSNNSFSKKKSPKSKKGKGLVLNTAVKSDKEASKRAHLATKPADPENNSSPVKVNVDNKKVKLPFKLDESLNILTPQKSKKNKDINPKTNSSPEVLLGIELEKALSPKSEKEKKKLLSKKNIPSKDILNNANAGDGSPKKKNKNKKKKRLSESQDQIDASVKVVDTNQIKDKGEKKNQKLEDKSNTTSKNDAPEEPAPQAKSGKKKRRRRAHKKPTEPEFAEFSLFGEINAKNGIKALLNTIKTKENKDLFGSDQFIYVQINLLKGSEKTKSVLHIVLPHLILPENPDVCLITPDLKGKRNDPDEAIDFYQDLLKKKGIDYISEIIPIRKLKKEYTSFEHRMKLSNRLDAVLVDGKVSKFARIGRRFARSKKCISNVQLDQENLKAEFEKALRRVALFSNGRGLSFSIKCGRLGMSLNDIAENIMAIGKCLAADKIIIGDVKNIGSVYVKTALSEAFPIYVSLINPNEVKVPEGKKRKLEEPVEDEISTVLGAKVVVHPTGNVRVKKIKTDSEPENESPKQKNEPKVDGKKKAASKKDLSQLHASSDEEDSDDEDDEGLDSDEDNDLDLKLLASSKLDSEDDDDDSEFEEDDEDASLSELNDSELVDSDDESDLEDQIVAAEREYLQEVRQMQDNIAKRKRDIKQAPNKPVQNQGKKPQPQKNEKKQAISSSSESSESKIEKDNKKKKQENKPGLNKPANQQKKAGKGENPQKKSENLSIQPQEKKQNQKNRKRRNSKSSPAPEKGNEMGFSNAKKGKFEKSGDSKKGALGKKPFQGGKKLKSS